MNINAEQLARGLGWFSIGLGLAELLTPRGVAKIAGVRGNTGLIRVMGLREIAHGIAIFAQGKRPTAAVWSRVAGDALDLAALGAAFASPDSSKGRVAFATANVLAVTALDVICAQQLSSGNQSTTEGGASKVKKSLIINRTPEELYRFWRDFENLPRFMKHLESVRVTGDGRSHWVAKAPAGSSVEWDAEITEDRPNELIAWRSLEGADVDNSGSVRFERAPGNRGTIVKVEIDYNPPGGVIGAAVAKLFGEEPGQQTQDALRCLKQVMETGEIIISDGTVWDNGLLTQRPAQPVSGDELKQSQDAASA
ncbi:MAG TPA: SRPBCC family protein [Pyrinomonadaceae bacterium]